MIRRPPSSTRTTHSFPTRRSSDLTRFIAAFPPSVRLSLSQIQASEPGRSFQICPTHCSANLTALRSEHAAGDGQAVSVPERSEEHTSELQSLMRISYAVFCLKKKTSTIKQKQTNTYDDER